MKRKLVTRIISVAVASCMMAGMLTGCGSTGDSTGAGESTSGGNGSRCGRGRSGGRKRRYRKRGRFRGICRSYLLDPERKDGRDRSFDGRI